MQIAALVTDTEHDVAVQHLGGMPQSGELLRLPAIEECQEYLQSRVSAVCQQILWYSRIASR